ncbi:MAG: hydroxymethylglutaryl-CoA reductase, degradative, partial [Pseudomonadota bacterium]
LPLGLVTGVVVDERHYVVPFVVEEPSIVAAASAAAKLAARHGGFRTGADDLLAIGQIELRGVRDRDAARRHLAEADRAIRDAVDAVHPNMVRRGGGVRRVDVRDGADVSRLVVHLVVDTCDAMGANLINSQCEAVAPLLAELANAEAGLRILSNYCDEALVSATMRVPAAALATRAMSGEEVRDAIVSANQFAATDAYRAVTHNKGVMNGIDPIALATGNDWRAIEAAAHAYAARNGSYRSLTEWRVSDDGDLEGRLELPMKVGTVGGTLAANPGARFGLAVLGIERAEELARVMVAVGLGQNFSALRALATHGIQRGHMRLHARSVVASIGVPAEQADAVTAALVASGEIKAWKAKELFRAIRAETSANGRGEAAAGKIIVAGEHAVVHGHRAVAVPIPDALSVRIEPASEQVRILIPAWQVRRELRREQGGLDAVVYTLLDRLGLTDVAIDVHVDARYPPGIGLGGSASLAVGLIRALNTHFRLELDDAAVNEHAYAAECLAHGRASGIDNTLAVYGRPLVYRRDLGAAGIEWLDPARDFELLVAVAASVQPTRRMVEQVAALHEALPVPTTGLMREIDTIAAASADALRAGKLAELGRLMNLNQGLLNALGVSTAELEMLCQIARDHGAWGAKLTGGGGGGAIIAVCDPDAQAAVRRQFEQRSIQHFAVPVAGLNRS